GTLDIYTVAMMIWGMGIYLRWNPVAAGITLGFAAAFKLVAPYLWASLVLLEAIRAISSWRRGWVPAAWRWWPALKRLVIATVTGFAAFIGILALMGQIAT